MPLARNEPLHVDFDGWTLAVTATVRVASIVARTIPTKSMWTVEGVFYRSGVGRL
jgi:hypothetical protein